MHAYIFSYICDKKWSYSFCSYSLLFFFQVLPENFAIKLNQYTFLSIIFWKVFIWCGVTAKKNTKEIWDIIIDIEEADDETASKKMSKNKTKVKLE